MTKTDIEPDQGLRLRAEEKMRQDKAPVLETMSLAEIRRTLNELRVHKIELEMQNEELRGGEETLLRKQQQLEELNLSLEAKIEERTKDLLLESNNLKRILDVMPNGVYIVDQHFRIKYANPALLLEFGMVEGRTCHEYLHGLQEVCPWCKNPEVFTGRTVHREWRSKKTGRTYSTFDSPYTTVEGELCKLSILHDITERTQLEEGLRHQLYFTQTLLDAIPNPVFYKNAEGRYLGCNKAYEDFRGITKEYLYGKNVHDIAMPEDVDAISTIDMKLLNGSEALQYETSLLMKDGSRREVIFHKARFNGSTGEPAGLIGVIQDISSLKNAERIINRHNEELEQRIIERTKSLEDANEELIVSNRELEVRRREAEKTHEKLQQLSSAVENSPATIVITNQLGLIEYTNPKFTETTGYLPEEAIGQNPRILKADVQPKELYSELWNTICAGREWRGNFCNLKKNGDTYWEHALIYPLRNEQGEITHFVAIKEDITEQKRTAEELQAARDAADAANRSKSEFLANMSHEIRTPLNAIIGFSSLALKGHLPPRQQDYVGKIHTAGELLLNIINDILDFSKIEAGRLEMEQIPFRLSIMISNVFGMVQQRAADKGLNLHVEPLPEVAAYLIGDPHRLGQIIINLLNNAVKFTEHGEVVLETEIVTRESDRAQLKFTLRDTGIGISGEQMSRLFQPFTQADGSTTRRFGGTGLGLSISKQLVEMMGGEIWCESISGQGSSFCFTAWFGIGQPGDLEWCVSDSTMNMEQEEPPNFSGSRILLVEDNEINRQLAIELLRETGAVVSVAVNGKEAVTMITGGGTSYDLVLMDIQMPVMDGYEATRLIRSDSRFATLPIIAMTAHALKEEQQKIIQGGLDAYITKPIDSGIMLRVIGIFLRKQEPGTHPRETREDRSDEDFSLPDVAGLDISGALSRLDGDRKLYLWVLHAFVESESDAAMVIEEALHSGEIKQALRHAHTIKGTAGSIGAVELEGLARALENAIALNESPTTIKPILESFSVELNRLVTDLTICLPVEPESSDDTLPGSVDLAVVTPILNRLYGYIQGCDGKAERFLDDYQRELAGLADTDVEQIKTLLKIFDFAAAHDALLALAAHNGITLTSVTEDCHS